jgi:hypothetical protein
MKSQRERLPPPGTSTSPTSAQSTWAPRRTADRAEGEPLGRRRGGRALHAAAQSWHRALPGSLARPAGRGCVWSADVGTEIDVPWAAGPPWFAAASMATLPIGALVSSKSRSTDRDVAPEDAAGGDA